MNQEERLDTLIDALNRGEQPTTEDDAEQEELARAVRQFQQLRQVEWPDAAYPDRLAERLSQRLSERRWRTPAPWRREMLGAAAVLAAGLALVVITVALRQGLVGSKTLQPAGHGITPPAGLSSAAVAFDGKNKTVVLMGGYTADVAAPQGETWTWNGSAWQRQSPATSPAAREFAGMAYDEAREVTVLFGGSALVGPAGKQSPQDQADTWTWDGKTWRLLHPAQSPPAMSSPAMAYDPALRVVVLFGKGQTWTWDGNTWNQLRPAGIPPVMDGSQMAMAYHAPTGTMLLFGHQAVGTAETWTFDGITWTAHPEVAGSAPSEILFGMAGDDARGKVVLFDDQGATWTWDGRSWSRAHPSTSPPARQQAAIVYDSARRVVVLFGGYRKSASADTWTWDGSTWSERR